MGREPAGGDAPLRPAVLVRALRRVCEVRSAPVIPLVGLAGWAGSGKDAVGQILQREHNYTRIAFADPIKSLAVRIGWNGQKDEKGRVLLQRLGIAAREVFGEHVWVTLAMAHADLAREVGALVCVTDVRFPNEVAAIRERGGVVFRVVRPGVAAANGHVSEHALDAIPLPAIVNDGSLADLGSLVGRLIAGKETDAA